jgi:hypothetical protein
MSEYRSRHRERERVSQQVEFPSLKPLGIIYRGCLGLAASKDGSYCVRLTVRLSEDHTAGDHDSNFCSGTRGAHDRSTGYMSLTRVAPARYAA